MNKNNKGITLVALAITIVIMLILVGLSIYLTISDNGLIQKATEGNKNQTLTELYEITDSELAYLKIAGKAKGKEEISIEKLYNRKGFSEHYEIRVKQYNIKGRPDYNYYVYKRVVQLPAKNNITIDPIDTSQRIIRGRAEPGAKIQIYHNSYGTYNVNADGARKLEL